MAALIIEDFRSRTVNLVWLVVLAVLSAVVALNIHGLWQTVINAGTNLFLLFYLGVGILIYLRFKQHRWINPLKEYMGAGDVVFLAAITPLFELRSYLLFLICGCVFSLLWGLIVRSICPQVRTIPFVATMGISLGITILINVFL